MSFGKKAFLVDKVDEVLLILSYPIPILPVYFTVYLFVASSRPRIENSANRRYHVRIRY